MSKQHDASVTLMSRQSLDAKPTLGIKTVLTVLCVLVGALLAFYLFR